MVEIINSLINAGTGCYAKQFIISGGIKNFLDIHYLRMKLRYPSIAGQASAAQIRSNIPRCVEQYIETQIKGLLFGQSFLTLKTDNPLNSDHFNGNKLKGIIICRKEELWFFKIVENRQVGMDCQ